jgi:hypothetical protein
MRRFINGSIVGLTLGMSAACHTAKGSYITGAATRSEAPSLNALWMITLPPVTVLAPRVPSPARDTAGARSKALRGTLGNVSTSPAWV